MTFETLLSSTILATLLVVLPGRNGLLIAKTVLTSGCAVWFAKVAGFFVSFYPQGALAIPGVSAILQPTRTNFTGPDHVVA